MQFNLVQILTESIVPMDNINHGKAISIPQPRKFQVWIPAIFQPRTMGQQPGGGNTTSLQLGRIVNLTPLVVPLKCATIDQRRREVEELKGTKPG